MKIAPILDAIGAAPHDLLGQGGESLVFALDHARVARINHRGTSRTQVDKRTALLTELSHSSDKVSFAIPAVLETLEIKDRIITIERRLPGRPLIKLLEEVTGEVRTAFIRAYLDAASQIGELAIHRPWYGDLLSNEAIGSNNYHEFLEQRAAQSLKAAGPEFKYVDPAQLAAALPEPDQQSLVHLDAFPGNMLADAHSITAVLDFGASCLIGDRRLDPLAAAVYLDPAITPAATEADRAVAQEWLEGRGLAGYFIAARNWLAAYWSFASDDTNLYRWCHKILVD